MYIVIVGCSEAGYYLARALVTSGHEVAVIERDLERYQLITEDLGIVALLGDGADTDVLREGRSGTGRRGGRADWSRRHQPGNLSNRPAHIPDSPHLDTGQRPQERAGI